MPQPLRLLLLEDEVADAELLVRALQHSDFAVSYDRVDNKKDFIALVGRDFDLIISDYQMPAFTGLEALNIVQSRKISIPFILVSGKIGEEVAVEAMRLGAADYLLKDRLARLGEAVRKALHAHKLQKDKEATDFALQVSQNRFLAFFDIDLIGMAITSPDKGMISANDQMCRILGYERNELLSLKWSQITHPDDLAADNHNFDRLMRGEIEGYNLEKRFIRKNGIVVSTRISVKCIRFPNGTIDYLLGLVEDISDRKEDELLRRKAAERFRQVVENIGEVFWLMDLEQNHMIYLSPGYEKIWGRPAASLYESFSSWPETLHADDRVRVTEERKSQAAGTYDTEYRIVRPDGEIRWVHDRAFPVKDSDGKVYRIAGVVEDITNRRVVELMVQAKETELAEAQRIAQIGSWEVDLNSGESIWSREQFKLLGLPPQDRKFSIEDYLSKLHPDDRTRLAGTIQRLLAERGTFDINHRIVHPDGQIRWMNGRAEVVVDASGKPIRMRGTNQDITDKTLADNALRNSETRYRRLFEAAKDGILILDAQTGMIEDVNPYLENLLGYGHANFIGKQLWNLGLFKDIEANKANLEDLQAKGYIRYDDLPLMTQAGSRISVEFVSNIYEVNGRPIIQCNIRNITERKIEADSLRESELRFRQLAENIDEVFYLRDTKTTQMLYVSPAYEKIWGQSCDSLYADAKAWREAMHPDDRERVNKVLSMAGQTSEFDVEYRIIRPDHTERFIRSRGYPIFSDGGEPYRYAGVAEDITERKRTEKSLREIEATARELGERLTTTLEDMPDAFFTINREWRVTYINKAFERLLQRSRSEIIGKVIWEQFKDAVGGPSDLQYHAAIRDGKAVSFEEFYPPVKKWFDIRAFPTLDGLAVYFSDITTRKEALEASQESDMRFRQLAENISKVFYLTDPEMKKMLYISPAYEKIWGRSCESAYANPKAWAEAIHPDDIARAMAVVAPHGSLVTSDIEYRILRPDGSERTVRARAFPVNNAHGEIYRYAGIVDDITEHKILERQLQQSQKMEAVGRLSGGIAHDFNNLLTIILGHAAILEMDDLSAGAKDSVTEIRNAADRAARLTRQLLLFARQEKVKLQCIDINTSIGQTTTMLQRILGEDINLDFHPSVAPLLVQADTGMLDQVLMNLAVNARDAMPKGGRLLIETTAVEFDAESASNSTQTRVGAFATLSVSDSGAGIPADVLPKIFDPFFTTKDVGAGTGLGLATVFGIVQQHGGWITVYSEVGLGTTFRIYLPLDKVGAQEKPVAATAVRIPRGSETLLVVEDEGTIRTLISKYLKGLGYHILTAANGAEALKVFSAEKSHITLVMTDMIMPGGMTGAELGVQLLKEKGDIKLIYSSGYSDMSATAGLKLNEGVNFLAKPFSLTALAAIVRNSLDTEKS